MISIFIDAVKVLSSRDVRDTSVTLLQMLQSSPQWQKDICTINAHISIKDRERSHFLEELIATKLKNINYQEDAIIAFRTTHRELAANAFEHGHTGKNKDIIGIKIDVCTTYVSITVSNAPKAIFDIKVLLLEARAALSVNPFSPRGRGLLFVEDLADQLIQSSPTSVKAVIYRDRVRIDVTQINNRTLVALRTGVTNPSAASRLLKKLQSIEGSAIVFLDQIDLEDTSTSRSDGSVQSNPNNASLSGSDRCHELQQIAGPSCNFSLIALDPDRQSLLFGRHSSCDIVLSCDTISRHHARLMYKYGQWALKDLESRHGTFLNGVRLDSNVGPTPLKEGDLVAMHPFVWRFERCHHQATSGSTTLAGIVVAYVADRNTLGFNWTIATRDETWKVMLPPDVQERHVSGLIGFMRDKYYKDHG